MNKIGLALSLLSSFVIGCNKDGGGSGGGEVKQTPWNAYSVSSATDLPTCSGDIIGRLYYLEMTTEFQVCKSTGWTNINVKGEKGSGVTVSSNKFISSDTTNYCTQYAGDSCYFKGGQIITFTDGSFFLTWWFRHVDTPSYVDVDDYGKTIFYPSGLTEVTPEISWRVGRGSGLRSIRLQYDIVNQTVKLYYDQDDSDTINTGDPILYTATLIAI